MIVRTALRYGFALAALAGLHNAQANNIQVTNTTLTDNGGGMATIQFDISWENSWRGGGVNNWDAAWVFVKYSFPGGGEAYHVDLAPSGHTTPGGIGIEPGLVRIGEPQAALWNPVVGVMIHRSSEGSGILTATGVQLMWEYSEQGLSSVNDVAELRVHAIEMVYINAGTYYLGSGGSETDHFQRSNFPEGFPYQVTSENLVTIGTGFNNLWTSAGTIAAGTLPADFPKGHAAFYMMKYEISQQQYVDFLNSLNRTQQNARVSTDLSVGTTTVVETFVMSHDGSVLRRQGIRCDAQVEPNASIVFYCDGNGNGTGGEVDDGQWLACNNLSVGDLAAYLHWCGLRPMSELEYEKACRGPLPPTPDEYPWRTATIATSPYMLSGEFTANEVVGTGYSLVAGNASYAATMSGMPVRVGMFAAHPSSTGRVTAGASYYGVMELAGGQMEFVVSAKTGQLFDRDIHGNGVLHPIEGRHYGQTELSWPSIESGEGFGGRGGASSSDASLLRVSDRTHAGLVNAHRLHMNGGRGVRTAP